MGSWLTDGPSGLPGATFGGPNADIAGLGTAPGGGGPGRESGSEGADDLGNR